MNEDLDERLTLVLELDDYEDIRKDAKTEDAMTEQKQKIKLSVKPGNAESIPMAFSTQGQEVFRITPDGEIEQHGRNITDDDAAVADCFRMWVKNECGKDVRPASRSPQDWASRFPS